MTEITTPLLDKINSPQDLRKLPVEELRNVCDEIRTYLIDSVSKTAGHLASGLAVVELTAAIHYVFNTPEDKLVWDVGHQSYPHKILTGNRERLKTIRQKGGLHAFIYRGETEYDLITTGHASTSIGSALGLAVAENKLGTHNKVVAVIGDGALSGGAAYEAMN
ncbi:MAG: 1-deoxy-D-xylulose-5-phosphate synthase N-terminal domain-containing protein, partial [Succinivibrio sp.]